jgi:biotin carboxyl carrier protein
MSIEIQLNKRLSEVELVSRDRNQLVVNVDGERYELDIIKVEEGMYSVLHNGNSYNIQIHDKDRSKQYQVSTFNQSFNVEIIDAETRYLMSRKGAQDEEGEKTISSPMPGKIVKIPVKAGQKVKSGQTVIIVSAMKMESEYKAGQDGIIKEVLVSEGDTIEGNQPLITLE